MQPVDMFPFSHFCAFARFSSPQVNGLEDEKKTKTSSILVNLAYF